MELEYYKIVNGRDHVQEFFNKMDWRRQTVVTYFLAAVTRDTFKDARLCKKLINAGGLWEFRIKHRGNQIRLLGMLASPKFVLLHGFVKKDKKTPRHEIEVALDRWKDYINRHA
jgi:phage-related protein